MTPQSVSDQDQPPKKEKGSWYMYALAIVVVAALLGGLYYIMTGVGTGDDNATDINPRSTVAVVNGVEIKGEDLNTSIVQISSTAAVQGVDVEDPNVQAEIADQAVEMLVNTELLKQEAEAQAIVVSDEQVQERLDQLVAEMGGEANLDTRMEELGIDDETLRRDIKIELTIQELLDGVFADAGIEVTQAEIEQVYEETGGEAAGLPPLEDVQEQIEAQVQASKEQEIVDAFILELRTSAELEVNL